MGYRISLDVSAIEFKQSLVLDEGRISEPDSTWKIHITGETHSAYETFIIPSVIEFLPDQISCFAAQH